VALCCAEVAGRYRTVTGLLCHCVENDGGCTLEVSVTFTPEEASREVGRTWKSSVTGIGEAESSKYMLARAANGQKRSAEWLEDYDLRDREEEAQGVETAQGGSGLSCLRIFRRYELRHIAVS
jgi:hypothetical protein